MYVSLGFIREIVVTIAERNLCWSHSIHFISGWLITNVFFLRYPESWMAPEWPANMKRKASDWFIVLFCLSTSAFVLLIFHALLCKFVSYDSKRQSKKERILSWDILNQPSVFKHFPDNLKWAWHHIVSNVNSTMRLFASNTTCRQKCNDAVSSVERDLSFQQMMG